jgi:O-antigen ligase/polysaccharide polymerase Wzy-like membrane protein
MGTAPLISTEVLQGRDGFARSPIEEFYISFFVWSLCAYAVFGKGYAYLGVPPAYVGEILLAFGTLVALRSGCLPATMASIPSLILLCLIGFVSIRTALDFPRYGVESLRDSVVVVYGVFAFIIAALVIERPARLGRVVRYYGYFCAWFPILSPMVLLLLITGAPQPPWPFSGWDLFSTRTGEMAVHLAGCLAFVLLGFRNVGWLWCFCVLVSAAAIFAQSRGGMLAMVIAALLAAFLSRNGKQAFRLAIVAAILCLVAGLAGLGIDTAGGRGLRLEQITANITSLFGDSTTGNLDGTKRWRMGWWEAIVQYTLYGEYFWYGKGYGPNLAVVDGFVVGQELGGPPLRSPHNAHLTILARSGVPGLALWAAMLATWLLMLARNAQAALMRGDVAWARFFQWLACYLIALVIDATFDVALEGPMLGIWFWTLFGLGLGSSLVYWSMYPSRSWIRRSHERQYQVE